MRDVETRIDDTIPTVLNQVILDFFLQDKFDKSYNKYLGVSSDGLIAKVRKGSSIGPKIVRGQYVIKSLGNPAKYYWKFKVKSAIKIGIQSTDYTKTYRYNGIEGVLETHDYKSEINVDKKLNKNDIVEMQLDMKNGTLSFWVNDKYLKRKDNYHINNSHILVEKGMKISYKLSIRFFRYGDGIEIIG